MARKRWYRWRRWGRKSEQPAGNSSPLKSNNKSSRLRKLATTGGIILVTAGGWYAVETQVMRAGMSFEGVPQYHSAAKKFELDIDKDIDWFEKATNRVFRNDAYMAGYSEKLGNPIWVTYQVLPKPDNQPRLKRPSSFNSDWRSTRCLLYLPCVEHEDYTSSGYDRGHLAPNHVIASRYGKKAQHETFLLTNISPQTPLLNRRAWQRLEEISANYFADKYAPFTVITGPIFDEKPKHLPGFKQIAIPKSFYKIFVREGEKPGDAPKVLAFIMPQEVKGNEDLRDFLVSVREIEQQTGLDFLHKLDDGVEAYVETLIDPQSWSFDYKIANQKSRY